MQEVANSTVTPNWNYHMRQNVYTSTKQSPIESRSSQSFKTIFLMVFFASYSTLHPALSIGSTVRPSIGPHFTFSAFLSVLSSLLLSKCPSDLLQHHPCPPARNYGCRVSGLVFSFWQRISGLNFSFLHQGFFFWNPFELCFSNFYFMCMRFLPKFGASVWRPGMPSLQSASRSCTNRFSGKWRP